MELSSRDSKPIIVTQGTLLCCMPQQVERLVSRARHINDSILLKAFSHEEQANGSSVLNENINHALALLWYIK